MESDTIVDPNEFNRLGRHLESSREMYAPYARHIDWRVPASMATLVGSYLPSGEHIDNEIINLSRYKK